MLDDTAIFASTFAIIGLTILVIVLFTEAGPAITAPPKPAWRNFWDILSVGDPDTASFWLAFAATVVGLGIATPYVSTTALPFRAPDNLVGIVLAGAAACKVTAMARDSHRLYAFGVFSELVVWVALSWSGLQNNIHGAAWLIYGALGIAELWVLIRLLVDDVRLGVRAEREASHPGGN